MLVSNIGHSSGKPGWRNRKTLAPQKRLPERACGFESRSRHPTCVPGRIVGTSPHNRYMYPRDTVDLALLLSELSILDRENSLICGVSVRAIRHWRYGTRRTGHATSASLPLRCPRCDGRELDAPAYAYLLGLYLGDGHIALGRRGVYALSITCCDGWPGLIVAAERAMASVMPTSSVFRSAKIGCHDIRSTSKHWPCLFPQHGPGRKHERKIELEPWQQVIVAEHAGDFARGLFHSDGYRGINRVRRALSDGDRWYEYPRYLFVNHSADILRLCGEALDRLDVDWRFSKPTTISVARREAVARLDEFVGPKF
jgi:hypothetical protein